ncbi:MAG: serine hydrolase [Hungatella sp.]|nr:serine hydrolase [Hungatella sp.]
MKKELEYSYPEKEGVDSRLIMNFLNEAEKTGSEIHGIIIIRHNKVIFEAYNEPYRAEIPHIMHSFTKCLTNTAVGLAFTQGLLDLDDPILKFLPEYEKDASEYLKRATIRNLITMRSGQSRGIGGNEWRPLKTSWLDAYFKVPFVKEPGSEFIYSSGNSYILSAIVQRLTGRTCREYLRENITEKIGTNDFDWMVSPEGICSGGNGVSLTVEDMARIGLLYLNKGEWEGEQLLSREWVDYAMGRRDLIPAPEGRKEYNFHWEHEGDLWEAKGMFGQTCALIPELDMVVAYTAADDRYVFSGILQRELADQVKKGGALEEKNGQILKDKGLRMTLENKNRSAEGHYVPAKPEYRFILDGRTDQITEISLILGEKEIIYGIRDHRGFHKVTAGKDCWLHGVTTMTGGYLHHQYEVEKARVSACAYWSDRNTLMMEWRYPEMAFFDHVSLTWEDGRVRIKRWVNMNSEALERPEITVEAV